MSFFSPHILWALVPLGLLFGFELFRHSVTAMSSWPKIVRAWLGTGSAPDMLLCNTVLLNIALLVFGWRRYNELHHEVSERRKAEERARELAEMDPLTGCLNRRSGGPAIDHLIASAGLRGLEVAVLMVDLDNFKQINDLNGHQTGDTVLQLKSTPLVATITVVDAYGVISKVRQATYLTYEPLLLLALIYMILTGILVVAFRYLENMVPTKR